MKIIDPSADASGESGKASIVGRVLKQLNSSRTKGSGVTPEAMIQTLKGLLDNRFCLLPKATVPGREAPLPLVLVGPTGMWVILVSSLRGMFRAAEGKWEEMDARTQSYRPGKPNLLAEVNASARLLAEHLAHLQIAIPNIEPVIFFAHPGVHVDANRPNARLVLADALARFAVSLTQSPAVLNVETIQQIVEALTNSNLAPAGKAEPDELEAAFQDRDEKGATHKLKMPHLPLEAIQEDEPEVIKRLSGRANFSRRQWGWLALLLVVNFLVLMALIAVVLFLA